MFDYERVTFLGNSPNSMYLFVYDRPSVCVCFPACGPQTRSSESAISWCQPGRAALIIHSCPNPTEASRLQTKTQHWGKCLNKMFRWYSIYIVSYITVKGRFNLHDDSAVDLWALFPEHCLRVSSRKLALYCTVWVSWILTNVNKRYLPYKHNLHIPSPTYSFCFFLCFCKRSDSEQKTSPGN